MIVVLNMSDSDNEQASQRGLYFCASRESLNGSNLVGGTKTQIVICLLSGLLLLVVGWRRLLCETSVQTYQDQILCMFCDQLKPNDNGRGYISRVSQRHCLCVGMSLAHKSGGAQTKNNLNRSSSIGSNSKPIVDHSSSSVARSFFGPRHTC